MTAYKYPIEKGKGRGLPTVGAKPRVFQVIRHKDGKGISGTGLIIDGVVLSSGKVIIEWHSGNRSVSIFDSLNSFLAVHVKPKYEGENEFRWIEGYKPAEDVAEVCDTVQKWVMAFADMKQKHRGALIAVLKGIRRKYDEVDASTPTTKEEK